MIVSNVIHYYVWGIVDRPRNIIFVDPIAIDNLVEHKVHGD